MKHLTAGVKIIDKRDINPHNGQPLCTFTDNLLGFACQPRNNCFIFKSYIGKDTKDAYEEFSDFFKIFEPKQKVFRQVSMGLLLHQCMCGAL
jgi:hypothetical protein